MMVQCCLRTRHLDAALECLDWMRVHGAHRPSALLYFDLLDAYAQAGDAGKVRERSSREPACLNTRFYISRAF